MILVALMPRSIPMNINGDYRKLRDIWGYLGIFGDVTFGSKRGVKEK
jgi:hypothetical protein